MKRFLSASIRATIMVVKAQCVFIELFLGGCTREKSVLKAHLMNECLKAELLNGI